jgi:integrase/recombinase XerC
MYIDTFLDYLKHEKRYSLHTIRSYQNDLKGFYNFCKHNKYNLEYENADYKIIRKWIVALMEDKLTAKTVNRKISTLNSYYKFLIKENKISENPMSKIVAPKIEKRLPVFVEETKINQLLDNYDFGNDFEGKRNKLIIELFYQTGIRLSELINIKINEIDLINKQFKVLGKRNKERIIPITDNLIEIIKDYLSERAKISNDDKYLFITKKGLPIYPKMVYRIIKSYLTLITTETKKSPHILRHTFATHMLNNGADINAIKEILGHSNLAATQIYTHNTLEKIKKIYKKAHPRS